MHDRCQMILLLHCISERYHQRVMLQTPPSRGNTAHTSPAASYTANPRSRPSSPKPAHRTYTSPEPLAHLPPTGESRFNEGSIIYYCYRQGGCVPDSQSSPARHSGRVIDLPRRAREGVVCIVAFGGKARRPPRRVCRLWHARDSEPMYRTGPVKPSARRIRRA